MKKNNKKFTAGLGVTAVLIGTLLNRVLAKYYGENATPMLLSFILPLLLCWCIFQLIKYKKKDMIVILAILLSVCIIVIGGVIDNIYIVVGGLVLTTIVLMIGIILLKKYN